jgi:glycosyltransferase involved in cell wall biosynthesis
LDAALSLSRELASKCELHLICEISPESGIGGPVTLRDCNFPQGFHQLDRKDYSKVFMNGMKDCLSNLQSFSLVVHNSNRAFYPQNLRVSWQAAKYIRSINPDILHFDDAVSRGVSLLYFLPELPLVMSIHDSKTHLGEKAGRWELIRKLFINRTKGLIFHSEYSKNTFFAGASSKKVNNLKIGVIPLGVYDVFTDTENKDKKIYNNNTVLFFGRITFYKGIEILFPNFHLIIAGAQNAGYSLPDPPQLANNGTCEFRLHYISLEEMTQLFTESAFIVLPYIESTQSGVISTAYAFRKPVIVTKVGGLPEMVEDYVTGRVIPPGDAEVLAEAIVELLKNPQLLRSMEDAINKKVLNELSWDRLTEMTLDLYNRVIKRKK